MDRGLVILEAHTPPWLEVAAELFRQYAGSLDFALDFQGFEEELAGLPGYYAPPRGCILVACEAGGEPAGCVALRPLEGDAGEVKRLYVRAEFQRRGVGRALAGEVIRRAARMGYRRLRLDTVASMEPAMNLYRSLGFQDIPPYCVNPLPDARFFEKCL